jgi:hypothetical protein
MTSNLLLIDLIERTAKSFKCHALGISVKPLQVSGAKSCTVIGLQATRTQPSSPPKSIVHFYVNLVSARIYGASSSSYAGFRAKYSAMEISLLIMFELMVFDGRDCVF